MIQSLADDGSGGCAGVPPVKYRKQQSLHLTAWQLSDNLSDMKKITARDFARNQAQAVSGLKAHETLAVTKHGKTVLLVSKPQPAKHRRVRAANLLKELQTLPMTEADGDEILKEFVGEAIF